MQKAHRYRNPYDIVAKCPKQVFPDVFEGGPAQADRSGNIAQVIVHQHDIGTRKRNIGAGANGTATMQISGTAEVGATVEVEIEGHRHSVVVGESGTWTVTFTADEIAAGEHTHDATITATDPLGNRTVIHETVVVDTFTTVSFWPMPR